MDDSKIIELYMERSEQAIPPHSSLPQQVPSQLAAQAMYSDTLLILLEC